MMDLRRIVSFLCMCFIIVSSISIATKPLLIASAAVSATPTGTVHLMATDEVVADGADVYFDNIFAGKLGAPPPLPPGQFYACPDLFDNCVWVELSFTAATGSHTIRVSKQDYQDFTQQISVSENQVTSLTVHLISKVYGSVQVYSMLDATDEALVSISDGNVVKDVGSMANTEELSDPFLIPRYYNYFNAAAGQYELRVAKTGYQDFVKTIDVVAGTSVMLYVTDFYREGMGMLDITSSHPDSLGSQVLIDDQPVGVTWDMGCGGVRFCTFSSGLLVDLEAARYNLTIIKDPATYYPYSTIVDVNLAKTTMVKFDLVERNNTPIAMVRVEPSVTGGEQVTLDGSDSYDLDSNILSYSWKQVLNPGDPKITLKNANTAQAKFTAPKTNDENGITLTFELTVSDGLRDGVSVPAQVNVQIMPGGTALPKIVDAGPDLSSNTDLPDKTGTILLFSPTDAEGARVFVDNQLKGSIKSENGLSMMEIKGVAPGTHSIRVEKIGYETFTDTVEVGENSRTQVTIVLKPAGPSTFAMTPLSGNSDISIIGGQTVQLVVKVTADGNQDSLTKEGDASGTVSLSCDIVPTSEDLQSTASGLVTCDLSPAEVSKFPSDVIVTLAGTDAVVARDSAIDYSLIITGKEEAPSNVEDKQDEQTLAYKVKLLPSQSSGGGADAISPVAMISTFGEPSPRKSIVFSGERSYDPGGGKIVQYQWDFGDGSPTLVTSENEVTHAFSQSNTYIVKLTVVDDDYSETAATTRVAVNSADSPLPLPIITAPGPYNSDTEVQFSAEKSYNPAGSQIVKYSWDFGDGSTGEGVSSAHTYSKPGSYMATLVVASADGKIAVKEYPIEVTPPPQIWDDPMVKGVLGAGGAAGGAIGFIKKVLGKKVSIFKKIPFLGSDDK
jgi:chitodextrinase